MGNPENKAARIVGQSRQPENGRMAFSGCFDGTGSLKNKPPGRGGSGGSGSADV
jgi:hypothetical protein